uniref:ENTH domain-containing protein n=1 Tax=Romanomermis culicivorax TaxID=13658 RepID=A0A915L098_ROMCU
WNAEIFLCKNYSESFPYGLEKCLWRKWLKKFRPNSTNFRRCFWISIREIYKLMPSLPHSGTKNKCLEKRFPKLFYRLVATLKDISVAMPQLQMAAISGNINTMRRQIKNVVGNYSIAEIKVREATSNDPWGPSGTLLSEIADLTHNPVSFSEIMQILWKRLSDHGKNWRHVYKSLVVMDYLVKLGSEKIASQCRENIFAIQTLKDFQFIEDNKDQGVSVREKAKQMVALLKDEERLKNERVKAMSAKKRYMQQGMGISFDGVTQRAKKSDALGKGLLGTSNSSSSTMQNDTNFGQCRPHSLDEEELQLQIALAISREEAQKEEEIRKNDSIRLQMALNQSRREDDSPNEQMEPKANTPMSSAINNISPATNDPWSPVEYTTPLINSDPWGDFQTNMASTSNLDPWNEKVSRNPAATLTFKISTSDLIDDFDPLKSNEISTTTLVKRTKTPAEFLGENCGLVNLDNLVSEPTLPSKVSRNRSTDDDEEVRSPNAYRYPNKAGRSFFASHFLMGGERFEIAQPEAYLFGENSDLNLLSSKPVQICLDNFMCSKRSLFICEILITHVDEKLTFPTFQSSSSSTNTEAIRPLHCLIALRKDSLKFVRQFADVDKVENANDNNSHSLSISGAKSKHVDETAEPTVWLIY